MPTHEELQALDQSLTTLYTTLRTASIEAPDAEVRARIRTSMDVTRDTIDTYAQLDLGNDNADLTSLTASLKTATKDLTDLKDKLAAIDKEIGSIAGALSAIDTVMEAAGKILPLAAGA